MKVIIIEAGDDYMDPVDEISIESDSIEDAIKAVGERYTVIRDADGGCCERVGVMDGDGYIAITVEPQ